MQNKRAGGAYFLIFEHDLKVAKKTTLDTRHSLYEINFIYNLQNGE